MINKGDTLNGTSAANYTYLEIKIEKRDHNERKHLEINVLTNIKIKMFDENITQHAMV